MSTVVSRTFASTPQHDAHATWTRIVNVLTRGTIGTKRTELLSVAGVAASIIADLAPKDSPIVVTCDGPRTRIYCVYDEDAIDGSNVNEDSLGFDPLKGDWQVSLPCLASDLAWVQDALKAQSSRITARELDDLPAADGSANASKSEDLVLDVKGFLGS